MIRALGALLVLLAGLAPAWGQTRLEGALIQGGLVLGVAPPGTDVRLDGRLLRVSAEGLFVFGLGRDAAARARLHLHYADGSSETRVLEIARRQYPIERIDGLPPNMVSPSADELARIQREAARIAEARRRDSPNPWFAAGFVWPLEGRVTGVYGSQRILNGEPRRPHYGVDIAAPEGTPVVAPAAGVVALAEADLFFTGGTVILDHGHGVSSAFSHLASVDVAPGQAVGQGDRIGTVGMSGRATGPHLDWRVNWFAERLDPALIAGPMPGQ